MAKPEGTPNKATLERVEVEIQNRIGEALDKIDAAVAQQNETGSNKYAGQVSEFAKANVTQGLRDLSAAKDAEFNYELGVTEPNRFMPTFGKGTFQKTGSEQHGMEELMRVSPELARKVKNSFPWLRLLGGVVLAMGIYFKSKIQTALTGQPAEPQSSSPIAATAEEYIEE